MKWIIPMTMVLVSYATAAKAMTFSCKDSEGLVAQLIFNSKSEVVWSEPWHAATSSAQYVGQDDAPYSPTKSYMLFNLEEFYTTNDSSYVLAVLFDRGGKAKAVVYFDNDGQAEEETSYDCIAK